MSRTSRGTGIGELFGPYTIYTALGKGMPKEERRRREKTKSFPKSNTKHQETDRVDVRVPEPRVC